MATKKELATTGDQVPAYLRKDGGRGNEGVEQEDLLIPRLGIVQALSPERKKADAKYIEGIEEGCIFNSVTRENYGPETLVCPVFYRKTWNLWKDRKKGGGFGGSYETEQAAIEERAMRNDSDDWEILDTPEHFVLVVGADGTTSEAMISMPRTKAKISRQWNTQIRIATGGNMDRFAFVYKLKGVEETNKDGESYYNWAVEPAGYAPETVYKTAEGVYDLIKAGAIRTQPEGEETTESEEY